MTSEKLVAILNKRIDECGKKPAYLLFPEELAAGEQFGIFENMSKEDRGDGTIIVKVSFQEKSFLCVMATT